MTPSSGAGNVGTTVTGTTLFTVEGGTQELRTLFHSFAEFSPETVDVLFKLDSSQSSVDTVIGRVTGTQASFIDSQLRLTGGNAPDLFLINPNGITFGAGATLSLPGSFVASSADSVLFAEGLSFSAIAPQAAPLLTVSRPVGLQFTAQTETSPSGTLSVQGNGHAVSSSNPIFLPYTHHGTTAGLSLSPGETLGLIGRPLQIEGGIISAASGRVSLGGVAAGTVDLEWKEQALLVDYDQVEQFDEVSLSQQALVNLSGAPAGTGQLQGRNVSVSDGSLVWSQNYGGTGAGTISVEASEELLLTGATPTVSAVSGLVAETVFLGGAGNIEVSAPRLTVQDGATIYSRSFSPAAGGTVKLDAEQAEIRGHVPIAPNVFTTVGTTTISGSGNAGEVVADVEHLSITDGGYFGSSTLGSGRGGDVTVEEADTILISGATPTGVPSIMTANTAGLTGDSGDLRIDTRELIVQESGLLTSSSIGVGNAGNVVVNASERVLISGEQQNLLPSSISSTVDFPPLAYQLLLGLSGTPKGAAGSVTITTPDLSIQDDSAVAVINMGEGDAGYIQITADKISLDRGYLDALTMDGTGGEIDLTVESLLLARNVSLIQTSAQGGDGDGGDISISAPIILGLGNSDITANAFQGNGGNIDITTQQLLGFEFQEQLTDGDDITASSEFGLSGTVEVNGFEVSPHADYVKLPEGMSDADEQLTAGCSEAQGQFVASGRGGLSVSPAASITFNHPWQDVRPVVAAATARREPTMARRIQPTSDEHTTPDSVEATHWSRNESNDVVLSANSAVSLGQGGACLSQR